MKIAILSCFYPFRGGIAQFNTNLQEELRKTCEVKAFNFKRQYPDFLFPGKTQYVENFGAVPAGDEPLLDTVDPLSWGQTAKAIQCWGPDLLILPYWMSWFSPSLSHVARRSRRNCIVVSLLHNVIPHEPKFFDRPLAKHFLSSCSGHVVLNGETGAELDSLIPQAKKLELFHPIYGQFGEKIDRGEAQERLGLDPSKKTLLFFGLIREYKGLDLLLEAFKSLDDGYQLVVAGEPYESFKRYRTIIDGTPSKDRIKLFLKYINDAEVKEFFSAADAVILPYKSASQSGISAICLNFGLPIVATDVGGLGQSIGDSGIGLLAKEVSAQAIAESIEKLFSDAGIRQKCLNSLSVLKEQLSWKSFCNRLLDFAGKLR